MRRSTFISLLCVVIIAGVAAANQPWFQLPKLPPSSQFGNLLINRTSAKYDMPSVTFSHWRHRLQYTCRVCHYELEFEMRVNATEISKERLLNGEFCGACHDGKTSFDQTECQSCHNGNIAYGEEKFKGLASLPKTEFGNGIDWSRAIRRKKIKPKQSILDENYTPIPFKKFLKLESEWAMVPPAIFSHRAHTRWLDCANCHPDIFNIKKKTTKHFSMVYMLEGKFCGVCHLKVAFPLDDCRRCHPDIKLNY